MPNTLILHRQGIGGTIHTESKTLLTPGCGGTNPGFYLALHEYTAGRYTIEIIMGGEKFLHPDPNELSKAEREKAMPKNPEEAMLMAEILITRDPADEWVIDRHVEASGWPVAAGTYGHRATDVQHARCFYCEATNTIRTTPGDGAGNICLLYWENDDVNHPRFDMDGWTRDEPATIPEDCRWRVLGPKAHDSFLAEHIQRDGPLKSKIWLAWLMSEYRKYGLKQCGA